MPWTPNDACDVWVFHFGTLSFFFHKKKLPKTKMKIVFLSFQGLMMEILLQLMSKENVEKIV